MNNTKQNRKLNTMNKNITKNTSTVGNTSSTIANKNTTRNTSTATNMANKNTTRNTSTATNMANKNTTRNTSTATNMANKNTTRNTSTASNMANKNTTRNTSTATNMANKNTTRNTSTSSNMANKNTTGNSSTSSNMANKNTTGNSSAIGNTKNTTKNLIAATMGNKNTTVSNKSNEKNKNIFFTSSENNKGWFLNNILLIILGLVIIVAVSVSIYYLVKYIKKKKVENREVINTSTTKPEVNEVFHIANNIFSFNEAENVCRAVNAELATEEQIAKAYNKGANWCSYGWVKSKDGKSRAYYPIQRDYWELIQNNESLGLKDQCGSPGVNGGPFDRDTLFGVNCYGVKRDPTNEERELTATLTASDLADNASAAYRDRVASAMFAPFAPGQWSGL
jgi:hypothetical protein